MTHKPINEFTEDEKNWMDTVAVNYILAQSDGFRLGYAQAIRDFTENIIDYWNGSDDKPQQSVLDTLVDMGVELGKRKGRARRNIEIATDKGYEQFYDWKGLNGFTLNLYTKSDEETEDETNQT